MSALILSCGKKQIDLTLIGSKSLNLDDGGSALPVVVRVYQLSGKERLENSDFMSLWKSDKEVLEGELVDRQEVTLLPGDKISLEVKPKKEAAYLAVMALFRKPRENHWREIISLKEKKVSSIQIKLLERGMELSLVN
jgi:type VI secretion system protein VasD